MLILVNLALNSPSSAESVETQPSGSTVAVTESEHTTKAEEETTVKPTEKPDEKATQKPTKKPDEKKENSKNSENSSKTESSNNSSLENSYNYYSSSGNSSSGSSSSSKSSSNSSSSNSNSSSNTQKATQKPTTKPEPKPTTKPTKPQDNVYLSYSSITVTKGDVVFLSLINAGNGVSWSVSNSSVLQNYGGGSNQCSFKALKKGSATVTASYNGKNYYCTVSVI